MNLKSQFQQAMILMDSQTAHITDKGSYIVVRTPDRPDYFWGNYIIMPSAPNRDSYSEYPRLWPKPQWPVAWQNIK